MAHAGATEALFSELGITPGISASLERLGFTHPTPIQAKAIPEGISGRDIIGIAQTGTGKTLAFGIPMLIQLSHHAGKQGLILLPTRELALQVDEELQKIGKSLGLRTVVLIGGAAMGPQLSGLAKKPHIIIATPGRLNDHLEQKTLTLGHVRVLVLDEADRMLDMGFLPQIKRVLDHVPKERQTMLFSATLSKEIIAIAGKHMRTPLSIEVAPPGTTAERVTQEVFMVGRDQKLPLLKRLLSEREGSVIVFTRTKFIAKKVARLLQREGIAAAEIHSNRSLGQRKEALGGFKSGKYRVLVATDIAARGIDVEGIALVVNFDIPKHAEDYVHRIGRTARAGRSGHAVSFALREEARDVRDIERLIRRPIPISTTPELPALPPGILDEGRGYQGDRAGRGGRFPRREGGRSTGRGNTYHAGTDRGGYGRPRGGGGGYASRRATRLA